MKRKDSQTGSHAALLTIKFSKITPDIFDRCCYLIVIRNIELKCSDLSLYTGFAQFSNSLMTRALHDNQHNQFSEASNKTYNTTTC